MKPYRPAFDTVRMRDDMALRGWMMGDLARASSLSHWTVSKFLSGRCQTAKVAAKLAHALGFSTRRYLISAKRMEAVS